MLAEVDRFIVPKEIVRRTEDSLRAAGRKGYELFVLWSGKPDGRTFRIEDGHVPRQTSSRTRRGLLVRVEGAALHRLNVWLHEHEQQLAAQIHAHPTDAFHSDTDDTFPIVTSLGGLSLVAADFCRDGLLAQTSAAFRLTTSGWKEVPLATIEEI